MAVKVKRVAGALAEARPPTQEKIQHEAEEERAERMAEGHRQLAQVREQFDGILARFSRGFLKYVEKHWEWVEPDWDTDPETWPPLAKLLWLNDRVIQLGSQMNWLRHFPGKPGWCGDCHPDGDLPEGWQRVTCIDHLPREGVKTLAQDWGLTA